MHALSYRSAVIAVLWLLPFAAIAQPASTGFAFVNVTVIPMDGERVLEQQTVLVSGDRIERVGPAATVTVPTGYTRIEGSGKFLAPGLAEMHGHIPAMSNPREDIEEVLFLYVSNGITTVRGMLGFPGQLALRDQANRGEIISPTLYLAGPSFSGSSINSPDQAVAKVRAQKEEGWDLLKVHPGLTRDEYDAMARTANEVGIRFGGHVPEDVGIDHALEMGQETFDHLDGYIVALNGDEGPVDERALHDLVEKSREAGVWVVPTMVLWESLWGTANIQELRSLPELRYVSERQAANWFARYERQRSDPGFDEAVSQNVITNRVRILHALNDGGVRVLMGTDAPQLFSVPGFSLRRELDRMIEAGMTPYEVLRSGTANVGAYFENADSFGTVAEGQRADLLLLSANPLDDISNVFDQDGVMVRGRWLSAAEIEKRLAEIADKYRREVAN